MKRLVVLSARGGMAAAGGCSIFVPPPSITEAQLSMGEIAVSLTDYLLTLECAIFAGILLRIDAGWPEIRRFFVAFFAFTALASLSGGTYHFLESSLSAIPAAILWRAAIISLGAVAFATWSIGACLLFTQSVRSHVIKAALIEFLGYSIYVVSVDDQFRVAIVNYVPAMIFLVVSFARRYRIHPQPPILIGLLGLAVTGAAAAIQSLGLALHPVFFNHNATYHLVQAIGFLLIFRTGMFFARIRRQEARS